MNSLRTKRILCPAKVNLLLAITGKREDGYHELVSLVSPLSFGDELVVELITDVETILLECDDPEVPTDDSNLVMKAAKRFFEISGCKQGVKFTLSKKIPMEAGLGGGSSDAAGALMVLNELFGNPLSESTLKEIASEVGSDCALFLRREPVIMRGRGEMIEPLAENEVASLKNQWLAVFKPEFGVSTSWAFGRLAKMNAYAQVEEIELRITHWRERRLSLDNVIYNNMQAPVFEKYAALPAFVEEAKSRLGVNVFMSGSGSSCFTLLDDFSEGKRLGELVSECWGDSSFFQLCRLCVD